MSFNSKIYKRTKAYKLKDLSKAREFNTRILKDYSITTTSCLGREVYPIKVKSSFITIGYLAYLVDKKKLDSLLGYLVNLGLKFSLKESCIIINYSKENTFLLVKLYKGNIYYKEWLFKREDLSRRFKEYKDYTIKVELVSFLSF